MGGTSRGGLVTTPGAYQPDYISSIPPYKFFTPSNAFVQRFRPDGSGIDFGTYLGTESATGTGMSQGPDGSIYVIGNGKIFRLSTDGSALLARTDFALIGGALTGGTASIVVDHAGAVYTSWRSTLGRWTSDLAQTAQGSLIGAGLGHLALDRNGKPLYYGAVDGDLRTAAPLQGPFSRTTGFLAMLQPDLSADIATYAGDHRQFAINGVAGFADGGLVLAGSTLSDYTETSDTDDVYVAALDLRVPPVRLDAIRNAASFAANPVAARETLVLTGRPFASDAAVSATVEGSAITVPVTILSRTSSTLTVELGAGSPTSGTLLWSIQSGTQRSNTVKMPMSEASPGIYTKDRSGKGQAVVFNKDGVPNDLDHPAIEGDPITVYATGGTPDIQPSLYVGGVYANGIEAKLEPAEGFTGLVYKLSVYMPPITEIVLRNPDIKTYTLPPTLPLHLIMGGVASQVVTISVKAK